MIFCNPMRKLCLLWLLIITFFAAQAQEKDSSYTSKISPTIELQGGTHLALAYPEHGVHRYFMGNGALSVGCDISLPQGLLVFGIGFKVWHHHYSTEAYQMNALFYGFPIFVGYQYVFPSQILISCKSGISFYKLGKYKMKVLGKTSGLPYQQQVEECLKDQGWIGADIEIGVGYQFHKNFSLNGSLYTLFPFSSIDDCYVIVTNTIRPMMGLKVGLKWNILSR